MEAYEVYWLDPKGGYQIIGVLPERRKNSARVTQVQKLPIRDIKTPE
jgi:hypothetical protein